MKINEILTELGNKKITKLQPGVSAEIDNGDGTKTQIDLKQNPNALNKDPRTKKVSVSTANSKQKTKTDDAKVGDVVDNDDET